MALEAAGAGLRPLSTSGIVDAAIEHAREDPVLYYGIAAPVVLPLVAVSIWFFDLTRDYRGEPEGYGLRVLAGSVAIALLLHLRFIVQGALAWALEHRLRGAEATPSAAWRAALRRPLVLTFAGVAFWGLVGVSSFLGFLPALVVFPGLVLGTTVGVLEDRSPLGTVSRAAKLGWQEIGRACGILFILALGALLLSVGLGVGVRALLDLARQVFFVDLARVDAFLQWKNPSFLFAIVAIALGVLEPVKTLAFALLYVDRRVRKEGFDLKRKVELVLKGAPAGGGAEPAREAAVESVEVAP